MKKTAYMLLLCAGAAISACKKDDDPSPATGSSQIIATPPPAGYIFPHLFANNQRKDEFKLWINGLDMSVQSRPEDLFDGGRLLMLDFNLKLTDKVNAEFIDPHGIFPAEKVKYFYARDVFYIITGNNSFADTIPMGTGNYDELTVTIGNYMVSSGPNDQFNITQEGTDFEVQTQKTVTDFGKSLRIYHPDTIAFLNSVITIK
jgi:hypothetical protein